MVANFPADVSAELIATANAICAPGKGILAADESTGTIGKRFDAIKVENTLENRVAYRELLFTTKGLGEFVSGTILYEETLYSKASDGRNMVDLLKAENIIPGIKVDKGLAVLPGTHDESATCGLDGLADRCQKYYQAGCRFAKWRAVLKIDESKNMPSPLSIQETAHTLARYAAICQQNRLVPIVEPEILSDGSHSLEKCAEVTEIVLAAVFKALSDHNILMEGCLLKPNMCLPGADNTGKPDEEACATATVRALMRTMPPAMVGVTFLSGGQSEVQATRCLNAMNSEKVRSKFNGGKPYPWALSFSYGRALQKSVLEAWKGDNANVKAAQEALMMRARANGQAQLGQYNASEDKHADASLYEKNYVY